MATTPEQIGIAASARYYGVPTLTITWLGPVTGSHSATVFGSINKTTMADRTQAEDNTGEVQNLRRRNKRIQIRVEAVPVAANIAAALAIAADLPIPMDILTAMTSTDDPQLDTTTDTDNTAIVDDASTRYTPDGHAVIDFTITIWIDKVFVAQTS